MKKILITGKNSYVGNSFERWVMENYPNDYHIEKISLRDDAWKEHDFSKYDSILHVAGIAHVSTNPKMENLYYRINRDLTIEVARKAKLEGVKQFIFMSSIIVYGNGVDRDGCIDEKTEPRPRDFYGNSKLEAEEKITTLINKEFNIAIIRPPMVYGKNSKGNYSKLAKAARKLAIFPDIENKRSMIHINNLSEFLRLIIDNEEGGIFFPQNKEYVKTSEMVKFIAEVHGNNIRLTKKFNPFIIPLINKVNLFNKVYGNLYYCKSLSEYKQDYRVLEFKQSIYATERN